ncbi:MAG: pilus assembly protein PilM [Planctomycetota bacterium]
MATQATACDLGSHSAKALVASAGKHGVKILRFAAVARGDDGGQPSLAGCGLPLAGAICGLTGRDMMLRYSQVPPTPDWQLRNLMDLEIADLSQQSGGALSADYNLMPTQDADAGVDTVLLALAKDEALDRCQGEIAAAGGSIAAFVPNCTALYNCFLKCGPVEADAVVCLVHVGHQTIDLAIVKGTDLLFARNLSTGAKVFDDAIAAAFGVSERKAEALKKDLLDIDPANRGRHASGQAEKVALAATSAAGAISSAIQSSISFCKAQTKMAELRVDRVLLSGGGARLRGLRGFLRESLRCPVEEFDPFANLDLSELPPAEAEQLAAMRSEAVVALGLAVGRLDDSLYAIEILPEAARKAQRFRERTVWNIAAGALVAAVLALEWSHGSKAVAATAVATAQLKRQISSATAIQGDAEAQIAANKAERTIVDHLASQSLVQHGLLRVTRAVAAHLPPQLWIEKIEASGGSASGQRKRPVIVVEGAGKEVNGVQTSGVILAFKQAMQADPGMAGLEPTMVPIPSQDKSERFRITVELAKEAQ